MSHFGTIASSLLRESGCIGDIAFNMEFVTGLHQTQSIALHLVGAVIVSAL